LLRLGFQRKENGYSRNASRLYQGATIEQMASAPSQQICNTPPSSYRFSRSVSGFLAADAKASVEVRRYGSILLKNSKNWRARKKSLTIKKISTIKKSANNIVDGLRAQNSQKIPPAPVDAS